MSKKSKALKLRLAVAKAEARAFREWRIGYKQWREDASLRDRQGETIPAREVCERLNALNESIAGLHALRAGHE